MTPERLHAMRVIVDKLLMLGVIEKNNSEYASNSFIVWKKEKGKNRLAQKYKTLNEHLGFDSYPSQVEDTLFQYWEVARVFSSIY